jgi:hypothetical protein
MAPFRDGVREGEKWLLLPARLPDGVIPAIKKDLSGWQAVKYQTTYLEF